MKKTRFFLFALLAGLLATSATPASAANKDMIQLQTQVQALQDQMARMQQSFDERMGVMKNLVEQTTDNINRLNQSLDTLNKNLQTQSTDQGAKVDQVSAQVQSLHDAVDELKARLAKVSKQLDDVQAAQQNLQSQP
ncbi:MAG: transporter, partial [Acidobacteria bacterium]